MMSETYLYRYEHGLRRGVLRYREKRFLAYCTLDNGEEIIAYCPNPGSMREGLADEGRTVWLSEVHSRGAKLKWRLEIVEQSEGVRVGVHPSLANKIVEQALQRRLITELNDYDSFRKEVKYGDGSRIDFLLEGRQGSVSTYLEVKSVSMSRGKIVEGHGQLAEFPDAPTARGLKHLFELEKVIRKGSRGVVLYIVQRDDCSCVGVAKDIDPKYEKKLRQLVDNINSPFFKVICYSCRADSAGLVLRDRLSFIL